MNSGDPAIVGRSLLDAEKALVQSEFIPEQTMEGIHVVWSTADRGSRLDVMDAEHASIIVEAALKLISRLDSLIDAVSDQRPVTS